MAEFSILPCIIYLQVLCKIGANNANNFTPLTPIKRLGTVSVIFRPHRRRIW